MIGGWSNSWAKAMRSVTLLGTLALALWGSPVDAGLYNPAEPGERMLNPRPGRATNPEPLEFFLSFLPKFEELRAVGMQGAIERPVPLRYSLVADMSPPPRLVPSSWSTDRRLGLSAYLIRRGKHREAIEILKPLSLREPNNFLALANLATAYQLERQEPGYAVDYLKQALTSAWPRAWADVPKDMKASLERIGWNEETLLWYRTAETYHLKLVTLRAREARGRPKGAAEPETLDDLFGVDFTYEGGGLPEKEKAKLPSNGLALVQQLLIWLPDDPRLYWLLGELYHAQGTPEDEAAARQIFKDLVEFNGRYRVPGTRDHYHALGKAPPLTPNVPAPDKEPVATPSPSDGNAIFDLRPLLVGFGAGVLVSLLAYWQVRELRRRRDVRR
jgi:tetratricopeptide (TPR) repeat protein